jgi:hypothetical protein
MCKAGALLFAPCKGLFAPLPCLFAALARLLTGMKGKQHESNRKRNHPRNPIA